MFHSSKFLPPFSSLHYLAHTTEGLMIESGHPVDGTTILFGTQQETQESSLVPPFPPFCLHPVLQAGWSILLEISLDSVTCIMPTARSKVLRWLSTHSYRSSDYNSISSLPLRCSQHNESRVSSGRDLVMSLLATQHSWNLIKTLQIVLITQIKDLSPALCLSHGPSACTPAISSLFQFLNHTTGSHTFLHGGLWASSCQ